MEVQRFRATVMAGGGGGHLVRVPPEVVAALGGKGRIPVRATFDGVPYRGSVVRMGGTPASVSARASSSGSAPASDRRSP